MDIVKALEFYGKDYHCEWSIGDTYESLNWSEENTLPKPSLDQLEVAYKDYRDHLDELAKNPPKVTTLNDIMNSVQEIKTTPLMTSVDQEIKDIKNQITDLQALYKDIQVGLGAIQGFLMQLPEIEKSLQDVKEMLQK